MCIDKIIFTTDTRASFADELRRQVSRASIVVCNNHILTDVKVWLQNSGSDDIKPLITETNIVLSCTSEIEFDEKYEEY